MAFNTILAPKKIDNSGLVFDVPNITALSDGSFAVTYSDFSNPNSVISQVFSAQGQGIAGGAAMPPTVLPEGYPNIAGLSGGGYALAWEQEIVVNGIGTNVIFTAVYDAQGNQVSTPHAASGGIGESSLPDVTALPTGGYVVTWGLQVASDNSDVAMAVFDNTGQQVGAVNVSNSPGIEDFIAFRATPVAALSNGNYVVTWSSGTLDAGHDIYTVIYNSQGQQVAAPTHVINSGVDDGDAQVAALANGGYALSWYGVTTQGVFQQLIYTAVYDAQGDQIATPVVVAGGANPGIAALTNGNYALFWDNGGIFTAVYNAQGQQISAPVNVSNGFADEITALSNGAYALTWEGQIADGSYDIFTAVYGAQGQQLVAPYNVSNSPGVNDFLATAAAQPNGSYAITWSSQGAILYDENLAIFQFVSDQNVDHVSIVSASDINIDLSAIITVGGDVTISDNQNLVTLDLHNLASVGGNFVISNNGALLTITLPSLTSVAGSVDLSNNDAATTISLGSVTTVGGSVNVNDNATVGSIDLGSVTSVGGSVDLSNNDAATTISLGSVITVGGSVNVNDNATVGSIDLGSVTSVGGSVDLSNNDAATTISLGSVTTVGGSINVNDNATVGSIDLGSVTSVGGSINVNDNATAGSIDLGSVTTVTGSVDLGGNTSVITIDLGALIQAGAIVISNKGVVTLNLSALVHAGGDVSITNNHSLLTIDMPDLTDVGGNFTIASNTAATGINLVGLSSVGGSLTVNNDTAATNIDMASLDSVGGSLTINNDTAASSINLAGLSSVGGSLDISGNTAATEINIAGLSSVGGSLTIDLAPDATVDASALGPGGGTVHVIGDDGHETTVILGSLAQMQGTLTITTADGVTLTSGAGLATITLTGTASDNTLIGSATAKNVINAGGGNDTANGGANDDLFTGDAGNDLLDGKGGTDTAAYSGNLADYHIVQNADGSLTVTDIRAGSPDGTDTVSNFELLKFADDTYTLAQVLPPPVITSNGGGDSAALSIVENTAAVTTVTASDPNAAQTLVFAIIGGADAAKFQIDAATGALSFKAAPDFEAPTDVGPNNLYDVIVQVSDGLHADAQALAVTVTNANEAPVVAALSATTGENDPAFIQDLLAGAGDPDFGDHLSVAGLDATVTTAGGRTLTLGTDYTLGNGTLALTAAGFAKFDGLSAAQSDQAVFHFGVSDGIAAIPDTLTLSIIGVNDAPFIANQTANQSATVGTPFSLILPANTFQDPDSGDHLTLSVARSDGTALPAWLSFDANTGTFSGTPGAADAGGIDIKLTATDTGQLAAFETFHVTVAGTSANHPPVIASDGGGDTASVIITDDSRYVATVHASDPDPQPTIKYSIVGGADAKLFSIDPATGLLLFKAEPREGHSYQVAVAASDGSLQDTQTIKVQVANGPFAFGNPGMADTFVLKPHFGIEIVDHFDAASPWHDVLELDHALFRNANADASPAETFNLIYNHSFQFGPDVVIVTDTHDIIDLRNTDLHKLTAGDFLLT